VELPEGDDPDDFVQAHGGAAFAEYIEEHRQDLPSFAYQRARRAGELETPEDRVETQRTIITSVARIPDPNLRREYVTRTSEVVGVPDADLFRMLEEERERLEKQARRRRERESRRQERAAPSRSEAPRSAKQSAAEGAPAAASGGDRPQSPPPAGPETDAEAEPRAAAAGPLPEERVLLRLMLEQGTRMIEHVLGHMALDEFTDGAPRALVQTLVEMYQAGDVRPQAILDGEHGDRLQRLAASAMMEEHEASTNWAEREDIPVPELNNRPYEAAESAMKLLKMDRVNAAIEQVRERAYEATQDGDEERMQRLQQKMMSLQELRKQIERGAFLED
jgi:DNA primase